MEFEIVRNLEEGPDYAPDWRHQVVQGYLAGVAASKDPTAEIQAICWNENDPYVRQYLKFRFNGRSVAKSAFQYAVGCHSRDSTAGAGSLIKAMIIADRTPEEIAQELGTAPLNIIAYAKIFFDVRRYLGNEVLLRRIVFHDVDGDIPAAEALRERRWLAAAFHRGWPGVEQIIFHRTPGTAEKLEELSLQLHGILTSRALEYVAYLETSGATPTEDDLRRFLAAQHAQARQPVNEPKGNSMAVFMTAIHGTLMQKAAISSDPKLVALREIHATPETCPATVRRLRTRFADPGRVEG